MKSSKKNALILALSIVFSFILLLAGCNNGEVSDETNGDVTEDLTVQIPLEFVRLRSTYKNIQFGKDYVFFNGTDCGVFKYNYKTGEVSNICTDPLCKHYGNGSSCRIANVRKSSMGYFHVYSDKMIYNAQLQNRDLGKKTLHLMSYNMKDMTNVLLDDNAGTSNQYCVSDKYIYFRNVTVRDGQSFFNFRQVDLSTGESRIFGKETDKKTEYDLIGAYGGKLYARDWEGTGTYICSEENPGNFQKFWDGPIGFVFTDGNELFFSSKESDISFFYNTDLDGNVISKYELKGGISFGSIIDGRNLYYVPMETVTITVPDGTKKDVHQRFIYKLDTETGETTVAFEFNGDYSMLWFINTANDILVHENKIYTYKLGGVVCPEGGVEGVDFDYFLLDDGVVIIDMATGDIEYVTATFNFNNKLQFEWNVEKIPMDIEGEK